MSLPPYIKHEQKYYTLLKQLVDDLTLSLHEKERVEKELKIIHHSSCSKYVYALYLLTQKCKKDKQYYVLRGTGSDTLLFYVLGISNINPNNKAFKKPLPYQVATGILEDPKSIGDEIEVSLSYRKKLHAYMKKCFSNDSDFYRVIDLNNKKFVYNQNKTVLIPKESDPRKYGDYIEAYGKSGFLSCYRNQKNTTNIIILAFSEMPNAVLMNDDLDSEQFKNRYLSFLKTISSKKKIKESSYIYKEQYINLKKEKLDIYKDNFVEFCLDVCRQINLDKDMTRNLIRCREDIWNAIDKLELSEDEKYGLFKQTYHGKLFHLEHETSIKNKYKSKHKQIIKELHDAKSTFPLIHVIYFVKRDIDSIEVNKV